MFKRVMVLMFFISLLVTTNAFGGDGFSDVASTDWYRGDLTYVISDHRHILSGFPDGTYRPGDELQVDQFIKCAIMAAGYEVEQPSSGYWAQNHINKAIELGYIERDAYSNYKRAITREEMAGIVRCLIDDVEGYDYEHFASIKNELPDYGDMSYTYRNDVVKVYEVGIITGYPDGAFKPKNTLKRSEATAVIRRIIDASARKPYMEEAIDYEEHFLGGSEWVDPVTASNEESVAEDLRLIRDERTVYDLNGKYDIQDYVGMMIKYDEIGIPSGQIEDIKNVMLRRFPNDFVSGIIDYIDDKDGWYDFLPEEEKWFYYEDYEIKIMDIISYPDTIAERSYSIQVQLWLR